MTAPTLALASFLDPAALLIVVGGTIASAVLRTPLADLGRAVRAVGLVARRPFAADPLLRQIEALSRIARRHGVLTLDRSVIEDGDVADAVARIVDGAGPDEVAALLAERRRARTERQAAAIDSWTGMAEAAPTMGMIGTLIGLVQLFATLDDPARVGGAMAVALLTTLYGALLAALVATPVATRLRRRAEQELAERQRLEPPLVALAARERPRVASRAA